MHAVYEGQKGAEKGKCEHTGKGSVGLGFTGQGEESDFILRAKGNHWWV